MSDETGKRVGDYQILNELGSGGMGRVYRVRNVISDRIDAMKVLLPDLAGQQELAARFLREIKLMASLNHPNIATLRTAFTANNQLVMVMEYVEGTTVAERLEQGAIPVPEALDYIDQVLSALSYAHQQGIIHRDIKPANMMLTPQGAIKLMDFGIAHVGQERGLTMTGATLGTLSYMSPEQVKGEAVDERSDLYSVGVTLYEMVTGQRPFQGGSDYSIMAAHVKESPRPPVELHPGLPEALNEIILMAIAKDPVLRFKSADAFRNALSSVRATLPAPSRLSVDATGAEVTAPALPSPTYTSMPAPSVTPQPESTSLPAPTMMPPPPPSTGHRGLYMTLGALIVLAVLVAAGVYIPRKSKTQATTTPATSGEAMGDATSQSASMDQPAAMPQTSSPQDSATLQPLPATGNAPPAPPPAPSTASVQSPNPLTPQVPLAAARDLENSSAPAAKSSASKPAKKLSARNSAMGGTTAPPQQEGADASAQQASPADNAAEMDELEHELDQLSTRAASVNSSLDRLQQQQASSGYGLRGDMAARQASLKTNLAKAQEAAEHGDMARAKKYQKLAEGDAEVLEHFLGR